MTDIVPAEAFPPGEFLRDELDERGWTQEEFATIIGRSPRMVSEIMGGKRGIAPNTAMLFSAALGTSAQFWMNLETSYRLYELSRSDPPPMRVAQEARLREAFPVRVLVKRGWIKESENIEVLESRVLRFYGVQRLDEEPSLRYAARQTDSTFRLTPSQEAWLYRVKQIAEGMAVKPYSKSALRDSLDKLATLRSAPEETRHAPRILTECGIRYVIVEPMPSSKIDGVCFWLDGNQPVIGMSMRIDRIDNFWFVLRHEIEHVLREDGKDAVIVDSSLRDVGMTPDDRPEEVAANEAAANFCVPTGELDDFLARVGTAVSEQRIVLFAERIGVHPGLVVGQFQWRFQRFNFLRKYLAKIRDTVVASATTDGFGRQLLETIE